MIQQNNIYYSHIQRNDLLGGTVKMEQDIQKVLVSEEEIQEKIKELAGQLTEEYKDRFPLAIGVLKGAMPFMADF